MSGGLSSLLHGPAWVSLSSNIYVFVFILCTLLGWDQVARLTPKCHLSLPRGMDSFIHSHSLHPISEPRPATIFPTLQQDFQHRNPAATWKIKAVEGGSPCTVRPCCGRQAPCCPLAAADTCTGPGSSRQHRVDAASSLLGARVCGHRPCLLSPIRASVADRGLWRQNVAVCPCTLRPVPGGGFPERPEPLNSTPLNCWILYCFQKYFKTFYYFYLMGRVLRMLQK